MSELRIDLNCDMGESFGNYLMGADEKIFPYITSCNIACGFHAGDPYHIERTLLGAKKFGVQVGAHPGYPDLAGFGRRYLRMSKMELRTCLKYQIAALKGMAESIGVQIKYVKPHGALYNQAARDEEEAKTIVEAVREIDPTLAVMGLAGSTFMEIASNMGIRFIAEAFADRRYDNHGHLQSREESGAVIDEPGEAAAQVISIVRDSKVESAYYEEVMMSAESICIHGDNPEAVPILKAIDSALRERNILKLPFQT